MATVKHNLMLPLGVGWETVAQLARDWFQVPRQLPDGSLALDAHTVLRGPVDLPRVHPAWADAMVELETQATRGGPVPQALARFPGIHQVYAEAEVIGSEREMVDFLLAAARYCAGALYTGGVILPREIEPDDRLVYSPVWLTPKALAAVARPALGIVQLSPAGPEPTDVYSLVSTNLYGTYHIYVSGIISVPMGLARHQWATNGAVIYEIRHDGDDRNSAEVIAQCAAAIARASEGLITNEDGFNVTYRRW